MTVSDPDHGAQRHDPLASQRAELLGQVLAAQFEIEAAMNELSDDTAALSQGRVQLQALSALQRQITASSPANLTTLRGEIIAAVAQATSAMQQSRAATGGTTAQEQADVATLAATSRAQVTAIMRDMHRFDGSLQFESNDEEAAYRQRERDRQTYVAQQQAKGTPTGDLNAAGGAVGQMADAAAHGAGESPEFRQRWDELVGSTSKLREQMVRDGQDVSEFDDRLREDLREIMRAKGIPEAKIDAVLAAHPNNPVNAMQAFVSEYGGAITTMEIEGLELAIKEGSMPSTQVAIKVQSAPEPPAPELLAGSLQSAVAEFKALGIVVAEQTTAATHGVTASVAGPVGRTATLS